MKEIDFSTLATRWSIFPDRRSYILNVVLPTHAEYSYFSADFWLKINSCTILKLKLRHILPICIYRCTVHQNVIITEHLFTVLFFSFSFRLV